MVGGRRESGRKKETERESDCSLSLSSSSERKTGQLAYLYLLTILDGLWVVSDGHVFLQVPQRDDTLLVADEELVAVGRVERETAD